MSDSTDPVSQPEKKRREKRRGRRRKIQAAKKELKERTDGERGRFGEYTRWKHHRVFQTVQVNQYTGSWQRATGILGLAAPALNGSGLIEFSLIATTDKPRACCAS